MNEFPVRMRWIPVVPSDIFSPVLIAALGVYLSLAGGAGNPVDCNAGSCHFSWYKTGVTVLLVLVFFISVGVSTRTTVRIAGLCVLYFSIPAFYLFVSDYPLLLLSKIYGGALGSFFGAYFVATLLYKYGEEGLALGLIKILFLVLVATVIYKIPRGLLDRQVYLFNGPIVFGWLMATGALASCYIFLVRKNPIAIFYAVVFGAGVILSFSRGPMLAFVVSIIVMLFADRRVSIFQSTKLVAAMLIILGVALFVFRDAFLASRLSEYRDVLLGSSGISGEVLLGSRSLIYEESFSALSGNLVFGIGGANFPDYSRFFGYPHNVHFEVLLEYGIFIFTFHVILIALLMYRSSGLIRSLVVFYSVSLSLSGDLAYMRYILSFGFPVLVLTANFDANKKRRVS